MRDMARATGVATQMGNQGTATDAFREQVEIIRAGDLGEIKDVYVWHGNGGTGKRPAPGDGGAARHARLGPVAGARARRGRTAASG